MRPFVLLVTCVCALHGGQAASQSLADVARVEQERRQHAPPGRVYTEADLRREPPPHVSPPVVPLPQAEPPEVLVPPTHGGVGSETYWRPRAHALRVSLASARDRATALDGRLRQLDAQLLTARTASGDQERAVTVTALAKARRDVRSLETQLELLTSTAAAAKVPAEWLQ